MKAIDLHSHTTASDGIKTPIELIDFSIKNSIGALAICDHDTVDGLNEAVNYTKDKSLILIPGIEFSVQYSGGTFHLLGLNLDFTQKDLLSETVKLKKIRDNRIYKIIDDLNSNGIDITFEDVKEFNSGGAFGRPHVARALVKKGYSKNTKSVFEDFLVKGKPGYIKKEKITLERALELIKKAGGVSSIAHPATLNIPMENFEEKLKGFVSIGVQGIEAYAHMHSNEDIAKYLSLAKKYNLLVTGGSDYHGDKDEVIGFYGDERQIPVNLYDNLISFIKKNN